MNIEFGCGQHPNKKDYKTCDIRSLPGIDFVCAAWDIDQFVDNNCVDNIFSRHFFEHLTFRQGKIVLEKWHKILKPGGRLEIILPNMTYHINQWISRSNSNELIQAQNGFWGAQRGDINDIWDIHKSGYDFDTLSATLQNAKFGKIKNLTTPLHDKHLWIECYK